jgi:acetamidase/formamidase
MTPNAQRHTIHHRHLGWDRSIAPVARIAPGESLEFDVIDASGGQLRATSTVDDVGRLDFGKINPVNGPMYIDGAELTCPRFESAARRPALSMRHARI